ncbi:MAG: methyltransferase, cyclopropane fatty acid synthase [Frankiales bacterium]|nr:methyltransferase, cyclopropane fatty acid synthase [Frankiales bacterium]
MTLASEPLPFPSGPVNPGRWPDIAEVTGSPLRARIAEALFRRVVRRLPVHVLLPDGQVLGAGGLTGPVMMLRRPETFYRRVGAAGLVGFGEAYMAGDWDAEDLSGVLTVFAREVANLIPPALQGLRGAATLRHPVSDRQSKTNQKRNIARHYDLSNELFEEFLDPTMTYSSALFTKDETGRIVADASLLAAGQHRKIDRLLDAAGVTEGSEVLEIGTGWGELALRAAARGATVLSVTLSEEQRKLALLRVEEAGWADRVQVEICDYRDVEGTFDAVLSVEMVEAVGYDYWPAYFATLDQRLKPGGKAALQAITMPHDRMMASRDTFTWVHKYIFPGGLIPSVTSVEQSVFEHTSLRVVDRFAFGQDYAETLRIWRERFEADPDTIEGLGFDQVFRRMWSLYLAYSEAGFRSGYLDVHQFVLEKGAGPRTLTGARPSGAVTP